MIDGADGHNIDIVWLSPLRITITNIKIIIDYFCNDDSDVIIFLGSLSRGTSQLLQTLS